MPSVSKSVTPCVRQRSDGWPFARFSVRSVERAAAQGSMETVAPSARSARCLLSAATQIPDRSGLPSGIFGAGAERFGFPSGVRGTPGVGDFHCADAGTKDAKRSTAPLRIDLRISIFASRLKASIQQGLLPQSDRGAV